MHLETTRLLIRDWDLEQDAGAAIALYGDPAVTQWIGDKSLDTTVEAVQARLQRYRDRTVNFPGLGCWAVESRERQVAIGTILLMPLPDKANAPSDDIEIGWHFCRASWGYGYATEAASAVMTYGFETLALPALYAVTLLDNARSVRVTQRLGMSDLGISDRYYGGFRLRLFRRHANDPEPAS
ncbi:MAG: GNAT family N-acetyltransferase [Cyanobacteria bacterium P01_F01_bin.86]